MRENHTTTTTIPSPSFGPDPPEPEPEPKPEPEPTSSSSFYTPPCPDQVLENVLENVLHFLTHRRDRNSASLVCKLWYRVEALTRSDLFIGNCYAVSPARVTNRFKKIRSVLIKGKPRFADFGLTPPSWGALLTPWISGFALAYKCLEKIHLKRMSISDDDLEIISKSFCFLKDLTFICCENLGSRGLAAVVSNCRQLSVLDLIDTEMYEYEVDWISCFPQTRTCLESLCFECIDFPLNFEALERLVTRSPSLKRLSVNRFVSIDQLHRLMARAPQLTHLGTGSFSPPEVWVPSEQDLVTAFSACKSLVYLSGFREVVSTYLPAIYPICANLTTLNFSYANLNAEELIPVISHCHNLQIFWALDSIGDEGLQAVSSTCKDLRELRVFPLDAREDSEGFVSEVGLLAISEGCRKLQSILYFCQQMTNAAVIAMSKNCPELVVFRLCIMGRHRPDYITNMPMDEGFGAIVMNCKKLTRLAVSGLLTDRAFEYIGQYGKLVRTLSVAFAGDTDMALKYVLEGCPKLLKLEVRDSPFGDSVLRAGMPHFYNMRFVWMSACRLTPLACKKIAREMPNLVVEVFANYPIAVEDDDDFVNTLYMYRSLDGPRNDAPECVRIL